MGDIDATILCSFAFDLKKKIRPPVRPPLLKKIVKDNHTIIFLGLMKNKLKWKARLFHTLNNSNGSVYLFLNHNQIVLLKSACTTRKAAQLITFDKFKNNVFLHVQMYAKIMIFCTKSARKIAEFQACIKLGKFYILMLHLPSGPMLSNSHYSFNKCFTVQHATWSWSISGSPLCFSYNLCHLLQPSHEWLLQLFVTGIHISLINTYISLHRLSLCFTPCSIF